MIKFPIIIGVLGWTILLFIICLFIKILFISKSKIMNTNQIIHGAIITLVLDVILLCTGIGSKIITHGLIIALIILFMFSVGVKIMLANCTKDNEATDWKAIGSYAFGAGIITIVVLAISLLAIV